MLQENNIWKVWDGMKTITGCKWRSGSATDGNVERANEFNLFYILFDCPVPALTTVCPATTPTSPPFLAPAATTSACPAITPSPPHSYSCTPPPGCQHRQCRPFSHLSAISTLDQVSNPLHPPANTHPHCKSGQRNAEETLHQESSWPGQSVPQTAEGLCP